MAQTVHLYLKANGQEIQGDSTQTSLGRENSIECLSYDQSAATIRAARSGLATGRRRYDPIIISKRIDRSSPLLERALTNNEIVEGVFKFFRPNPNGDGTTEQFYTVTFKQGRIGRIEELVPDTLNPPDSSRPPMEQVAFVFRTISWTYGAASHDDSWTPPAGVFS